MSRTLSSKQFYDVYNERIIQSGFVEDIQYYHTYRDRYRSTLKFITDLDLPDKPRVLDIGAGQFAVLMKNIWNDDCTVADISDEYAGTIRDLGLEHIKFDLVRDEPEPYAGQFDLIILSEVIEHMPIPPYMVLEKLRTMLAPQGRLVVTTPNLSRLRNVILLLTKGSIFSTWEVPEDSRGLGHVKEYTAEEMEWHLRRAGFEHTDVYLTQLTNGASSTGAKIFRLLSTPFRLRDKWKDNIVAIGS